MPNLPTAETKFTLLIWLHFLAGTAICPRYNSSDSTASCGFLKCLIYHNEIPHSISSDQGPTLEGNKYSNEFIPVEFIGLIHTYRYTNVSIHILNSLVLYIRVYHSKEVDLI